MKVPKLKADAETVARAKARAKATQDAPAPKRRGKPSPLEAAPLSDKAQEDLGVIRKRNDEYCEQILEGTRNPTATPKFLETTPEPPYVALDDERHSCICLAEEGKYTYFIAMQSEEMSVGRMAPHNFRKHFHACDYPLSRAAKLYIEHAKLTGAQDNAREALEAIMAGTSITVVRGYMENQMSNEEAGDAATETPKKSKGGKAKKAAAKAKPAPKGKAKKAAKADGEGGVGRSKFPGTAKIKVLKKGETGAREGTKKYDLRSLVLKGGTVTEVLDRKTKDGTFVTGTVLGNMVGEGIISVG